VVRSSAKLSSWLQPECRDMNVSRVDVDQNEWTSQDMQQVKIVEGENELNRMRWYVVLETRLAKDEFKSCRESSVVEKRVPGRTLFFAGLRPLPGYLFCNSSQ